MQRKPGPGQRSVVFEPGGFESLGKRERGLEGGGFFGINVENVDFRTQRIAERGLNGDTSQRKRSCIRP